MTQLRLSIRRQLLKLLLSLLDTPLPPRGSLRQEQYITAMSKAYQNPAITQYLDEREEVLIKEGMNQFMAGKLTSVDRYAGQLFELRTLRNRMRVCYDRKHREQKKTSASPTRRHSRDDTSGTE
jgi:hypothetical protein